MDATELPKYLLQNRKAFNHIEGYIKPKRTLSNFAPLLQLKAQNLKATLLMLFPNAIMEKEKELGTRYQKADLPRRMERLHNLIGDDTDIMARIATRDETVRYDLEFLRRSSLHDMFSDFDRLFDLYLKDVRMHELAKDL
ncbi:hypothetical protein K469DRAFT_689972 [Zopfia rhizophila CBS 207.26]|uniref:Uncharacterized protein n=1 Tax=Zopfia rhizophila CBS 207.26 TaxID=1314779 RepID=A0A6A6E0S1_9PEZI|nr:hypothetical protein K469DRAFT_689972 [Zopfia rhizophila CBS 207.26]